MSCTLAIEIGDTMVTETCPVAVVCENALNANVASAAAVSNVTLLHDLWF